MMRDKNRITVAGRLFGEDDFFQRQNRELLSFTGSILDNTPQTHRIAKIHNRITIQETDYHKKRYFLEQVGMLSQWFDINLLDRAVSLLEKIGSRKDSSIEEEIKKTLTCLDVLLRLEGNTIRWKTITEISDYLSLDITKKSLFKYRTSVHRLLFELYGKSIVLEKLKKGPVLLMRQLICEFIANDPDLKNLNNEDHEPKLSIKNGCFQIITAMNNLKYIPKDYEIYSYAIYSIVKKGITGKAGRYSFPVNTPTMRKSISNAVYTIRKRVIMKVWDQKSPDNRIDNDQQTVRVSFL